MESQHIFWRVFKNRFKFIIKTHNSRELLLFYFSHVSYAVLLIVDNVKSLLGDLHML